MNRLGLLKPSELGSEAKAFYDEIYRYLSDKYSDGVPPRRNVRDDGVMLGPFGIHLHTPAVGHHFHGLGSSVEQIPGLSKRSREIAILTTVARFRAAYCSDAHVTIGRAAGLTQAEIDALLAGTCPPSFDGGEGDDRAVWEAARDLVNGAGPLAQDKWEGLLRRFGRDGPKHLIHLVGFYSYLGVVLNGFDAKVPEEQ